MQIPQLQKKKNTSKIKKQTEVRSAFHCYSDGKPRSLES